MSAELKTRLLTMFKSVKLDFLQSDLPLYTIMNHLIHPKKQLLILLIYILKWKNIIVFYYL
jgi:hypothetical protein